MKGNYNVSKLMSTITLSQRFKTMQTILQEKFYQNTQGTDHLYLIEAEIYTKQEIKIGNHRILKQEALFNLLYEVSMTLIAEKNNKKKLQANIIY